MKLLFMTVLLVSWQVLSAQNESGSMGARCGGMGYASVAGDDVFSLFNNIGALAGVTRTSAGMAYEARPSLNGADRMACVFVIPSKAGVSGIGVFRFGDTFYNEQVVGAGFSNQFGIASLGLKTNYVQYSTALTGTKRAISIDFGGRAQLTPMISVAAAIVNISQAKLSEDELLPVRFTAGLSIKPQSDFFFVAEIEKQLGFDVSCRLGAEYTIQKKIFFRSGFTINPLRATGGLGFRKGRLSIDHSMAFSRVAGAAFQASAIYRIKA